jgi:glycosyltransferase involved in cell wall biosynthesis
MTKSTSVRKGYPGLSPTELPALPDDPSVSVVITSYNYAPFISGALDSVLSQDSRKLEVIVADDGSTDATLETVRKYASADPRVRLITGENVGQPRNTNRGFAASSGDIICFLDADDEFAPHKISAVVQAFQSFPDCGLCLHRLRPIDEKGREVGPPFPKFIDSGWLCERLLASGGRCSFPATSAISIRRPIAERVFPILSDSRRVGDAFIHYPAAFLTNVCSLPGPYSRYRYHDSNMTRCAKNPVDISLSMLVECEEIFRTNTSFVARELGVQYAKEMRLADSRLFVEDALHYALLTGERRYKDLSAEYLLGLLPKGLRRTLWATLLNLPSPLASVAFNLRKTSKSLWRSIHGRLSELDRFRLLSTKENRAMNACQSE